MPVRPALYADIDSIKILSDQCFGKEYHQENSIRNFIDHHEWHLAVYEENKDIKGFVLLLTGSFDRILEEIGIIHRGALKELANRGDICLRKSTCVKGDSRGKGLGSLMAGYAVESYPRHLHMSLSWKKNDKVPMQHIGENLGFKVIQELKEYWREESLNKNYDCPHCGDPPCTCPALIMVREKSA